MLIAYFVIIMIISVVIYLYVNWRYDYWKNRNVQLVCECKFPFGTLQNPFIHQLQNVGIHAKDCYDDIKSRGLKHGGGYLFFYPIYVPTDINYIKDILVKNFNSFTERGFFYNERDDPLSANLFAIGGEKWKTIRNILSPAFNTRKLKAMFGNMLTCGEELQSMVNRCYENKLPLPIKEAAACFTTDVIGSCGFGVDCNSLKNPDAEFRKHGKKIFEFTSLLRCIKVPLAFGFPNFSRFVGLTLFDRDHTTFFENVVRDTIKFRISQNLVRDDLLQLLVEAKNITQLEHVTQEVVKELTPQIFIFFAAGFETSSITLTWCLYELALHPGIQKRLKNEIDLVLDRYNGQITYDAVMEMKYLGQVVDETLRKYPPVSHITRVCQNNFNISGLHHDPEYYPEPQKFDPERFSEANKRIRNSITYIPFGDGPRICIGLRFGLMQTKIGIVSLLKNYSFSLNPRIEVPLEIDIWSFTLMPKSEILLDVTKSS